MKKMKALVTVILMVLTVSAFAGWGLDSLTSSSKKSSDTEESSDKGSSKYDDFKEERPEVAYVGSGNNNIDEVGKEVASIYGKTNVMLDDYMKGTEAHRTYVSFVNDVADMTPKEEKEYYDKLPKEKKDEINAVVKLKSVSNLSHAGDYLGSATKLSLAVAKVALEQKNKATSNPFGAATGALGAAKSLKNMGTQIHWSVKALTFMKHQYDIVERAKNYTGR